MALRICFLTHLVRTGQSEKINFSPFHWRWIQINAQLPMHDTPDQKYRDGILRHHFNKRLESFASCYSISSTNGLKKTTLLSSFKNLTKNPKQENSSLCPETSTKNSVQEFGLLPLEAESVEGVSLLVVSLQQAQVRLPLVPNYLGQNFFYKNRKNMLDLTGVRV